MYDVKVLHLLDKVIESLEVIQQIPWREVMGMRDIIVHHYFEVDADVIFNTVKENIPLLMDTLLQMREDLKE